MPVLGMVVDTAPSPADPARRYRGLMAAVTTGAPGFLCVGAAAGDVVALGRYHRFPDGHGVTVRRRLTGGRAVAAGTGFLEVGLVLPHRAALVADRPEALGPEQVMNRCVRGILAGLELAGLDASYPGRDTITLGGRVLGFLAFEVDAAGTLLFEAILGCGRDPGILPVLLDRADPAGAVTAAMLPPDQVTDLARALGREPPPAEVAAWLSAGYARRFDVGFAPAAAAGTDEAPAEGWTRQRAGRLSHRGRTATMLGALEVDLELAPDGTIAELWLTGDLIANSPAIERLERELRGARPERAALQAVVDRVFGDPANFVLGIGPPATITATILRALGR